MLARIVAWVTRARAQRAAGRTAAAALIDQIDRKADALEARQARVADTLRRRLSAEAAVVARPPLGVVHHDRA